MWGRGVVWMPGWWPSRVGVAASVKLTPFLNQVSPRTDNVRFFSAQLILRETSLILPSFCTIAIYKMAFVNSQFRPPFSFPDSPAGSEYIVFRCGAYSPNTSFSRLNFWILSNLSYIAVLMKHKGVTYTASGCPSLVVFVFFFSYFNHRHHRLLEPWKHFREYSTEGTPCLLQAKSWKRCLRLRA